MRNGFTIIEVLIVLAIVGFILLIVFLAVPTLNRNSRNYQRKQAVNYTASQMESYYTQLAVYPLSGTASSADDRTSFINGLKKGPAAAYTIRYTDEYGSHEYPYDLTDPTTALDEISIQPGHKCNRYLSPGNTDYPLQTARGGDRDFKAYAVWTELETSGNAAGNAYCVDNS